MTTTPLRPPAGLDLVALCERLTALCGADVVVHGGWQPAAERAALATARAAGRALVSVRIGSDEVLVGPLWREDADRPVGCAGCAEARERQVLGHPLDGDATAARSGADAPLHPALPELVEAAVALLEVAPLAPGDLLAIGAAGVRRHRVARSVACSACTALPADVPPDREPEPPRAPSLVSRPGADGDASRGARATPLLDETRLEAEAVDRRFGPVRRVLRESHTPFAMSMAVLAGASVMGHGRSLRFAGTRSVAVLEAYERLAGFPFDAPVVLDRAYTDVAGHAVDPLRLGRYTAEQLAHSTSRVVPYRPDLPIDWVWGHDLADATPRLVPADLAFYQYDGHHRRDLRASRAADRTPRRTFLESSSGCAVGSSFEEAALHALFEVAERDAFQLAWHRRLPLPAVPVHSIEDDAVRAMTELVEARGYEVHVLVATQDVAVPVVWVLALRVDGAFPASFSSAGSGIDPVGAVRSALREVAQLVTNPVDWTRADVEPMLADPWQVVELADHVRYFSVPETAPRAAAALGGPSVRFQDVFARWPEGVAEEAGHDVRGLLDLVAGSFADAGCPEVVLVDQSSREHLDRGVHAVRAVVPGTVPMCFGTAHQRLAGIPRLDAALAGTPGERLPLDPHPFP